MSTVNSNNFVTSFMLKAGSNQPPLTIISQATPPSSLSGTFVGVDNSVTDTVTTYETNTMTTPTFISNINGNLLQLSALSTNPSLTEYGNTELKSLIDGKSAEIQLSMGTMDPLLPYSGNIDQTKLIKFLFLGIKRGISGLMTSGEYKVTVIPTVSKQTSVGGVETARPKPQTLSVIAEKNASISQMLKKLNNNDMSMAAGISQIGYSITGQKQCYSSNTAEINRLRWEIYQLQVERVTASPSQQIIIDAQIANLNTQISTLEAQDRASCTTYNTDPVLSIQAIRNEVNSILGLGNSAKVSLTGKVTTYTGTPAQPIYPQNPCTPCHPCPTTCYPCPTTYPTTSTTFPLTTTKRWPYWSLSGTTTTTTTTTNSQITSLEASILNARNQLVILTDEYNQKVSNGTATQADLQAYTTQYANLQASIVSMEEQLANLKKTYTRYPYWGNIYLPNWNTSYQNLWTSNQKMSTTQLNKALNSLSIVDAYVDMNDETTPGIISFLNATITQSGNDISINYLFSLQDQAYSVSVSGVKTGTLAYYGSNFLSAISSLTNSQKSSICNLFGVSTSSVPTTQDMWNTFCVAIFTYPAIAIFIVATMIQNGQFIAGVTNLGIETLLAQQSISSMSNGTIPSLAGTCFSDTTQIMNFGVLKCLVGLIYLSNLGDQELVNATLGLTNQGIFGQFLA